MSTLPPVPQSMLCPRTNVEEVNCVNHLLLIKHKKVFCFWAPTTMLFGFDWKIWTGQNSDPGANYNFERGSEGGLQNHVKSIIII